MKKVYYVNNISMPDIMQIEEKLYRLYRDTILKFEKSFSQYESSVELIECWTTEDLDNATNIRPTFERKYAYWICYKVLRDGKIIVYDDENSPLARSYIVLSISKTIKQGKCKVVVKEFDDTRDVIEELQDDLDKIEQMRNTGDGSLS